MFPKKCKCCNTDIYGNGNSNYCKGCDIKFREFIVLYTRLIESLFNYYFPTTEENH